MGLTVPMVEDCFCECGLDKGDESWRWLESGCIDLTDRSDVGMM